MVFRISIIVLNDRFYSLQPAQAPIQPTQTSKHLKIRTKSKYSFTTATTHSSGLTSDSPPPMILFVSKIVD